MAVMSSNNIRQLITIMDSISKRGQAIRAIRGFIKVFYKSLVYFLCHSSLFNDFCEANATEVINCGVYEDCCEWKFLEKRIFFKYSFKMFELNQALIMQESVNFNDLYFYFIKFLADWDLD